MGFDQTAVAEIAGRAGLTERTFFRHFPDKREVLFSGSGEPQDPMVSGVVDAPESVTPLEAVAAGLDAAAALLEERRGRDYARRRQAIIVANAELQERELIKLARLASALADTLRERGEEEPVAALIGERAAVSCVRTAVREAPPPVASSRSPRR